MVGGTLMRQTSHPAYTASPYGYQTMMTGKQMMAAGYNGMTMSPGANMMTSQPNFAMDFGAQTMMPGMAGKPLNCSIDLFFEN